jgi:acetyltransferase
VQGAVIISAGGKESGAKGRELEAAIKHEAEPSGLRIIGPNCLGVICSSSKLNASFASHMPLPGRMAFISQSGAICTSTLDLSIREKIGFSYFVSLGSMLDVNFGDMIDYLGGEPDVSSIVMYVENLSRFRYFMSAARAVSRIKPIIVLKAGRTRAGAVAAASHTGALAGEDAVYDAAFKRAGILRVNTFEELFDCAELLAKQPRVLGNGLAIVTNAGGPGVMAADALSDYGVDPVKLSPETLSKLNKILPPYWSHANPVDTLGDASPELYRKAVEICIEDTRVDGLLIMLAPVALRNMVDTAKPLVDLLRKRPYPVFVSCMGGPDAEKAREIFNRSGIPTFDTPERAVRAFMDLYNHSKNIELLQEIPSKLPGKMEFDRKKAKSIISSIISAGLESKKHVLTEVEAKSLLSAYGIPVNRTELVASDTEAVLKARELGFPVVMKICSRDIIHKTEADGVILNVQSESVVRDSYIKLMERARDYNPDAAIEGITIQPMIKHIDCELIIGSKKDRDFGPVILFGMGGTMTEILGDQALALPPLNRLLARRLMEETKVYNVLKGYRNRPAADLMLLEEILIRLAQLVTDFPEIDELDINPLIVAINNTSVVDARIMLKYSEIPATLHLVISPYPNQYETKTVLEGIGDVFIRPIRPDDAPLLVELFESLSPRSIYNRFFSLLKSLSHNMLARFTQIDYDREIALVALCKTETNEKILGVARVINEIDQKHAEFSVLVEEPWEGKGIGAELLQRCLSITKERNLETVYGQVLSENTQMVALGRKLNFKIKRIADSNEYELVIDLRQPLHGGQVIVQT